MNNLINDLIKEGYLKSDLIIDAFSEINRVEFLPDDLKKEALANVALPIGYGRIILQPSVMASMLELLNPQRGHNVLVIGSSSGWAVTLFCYIVGRQGQVTAVERNSSLMQWGENNVDKYNYRRNGKEGVAEFYNIDGTKGFKKNAPYDDILVLSPMKIISKNLKKQLFVGGKLVALVKNNIYYLEKKSQKDFYEEEYPGFGGAPLVVN
jgi:protein-L-isoaspartate(D-aspartate) O-methyltransferase